MDRNEPELGDWTLAAPPVETKPQRFQKVFMIIALGLIFGISAWMKSGGSFNTIF